MKRRIVFGFAALVSLLSMGVIYAAVGGEEEELMVEISVTNLTRGQTFSPVFVVRHDRNAAPLYELGQPPSEALANLAEDGSASDFLSELSPDTNSSVGESRVISGLLAPGQTATAEFSITDGKKLLSLASMLVSTNDAFFGANALDLSKSRTFYLNVYDAGSEVNSEDCAYVPGPPCGSHAARDTSGAEGFVHVHAGVHGGAGLDPAQHDWRNPGARLVVKTWTLSR